MELNSNLALTLLTETILRIDNPTPEPSILPLSCFDRIVHGYPVTIFFLYNKPSSNNSSSIHTTIKNSLPKTLTHFSPFAGTISRSSRNGEVLRNNRGVRLLEASTNFPSSQLDFHDLDMITKLTLMPPPLDFLVNIQLNYYSCGTFSLSWMFDHQLADVVRLRKVRHFLLRNC